MLAAEEEEEMASEEKRPSVLRVGAKLEGYCSGAFGREYTNTYRVEAVGADWVVARNQKGTPYFFEGSPEFLLPHVLDPSATEEG